MRFTITALVALASVAAARGLSNSLYTRSSDMDDFDLEPRDFHDSFGAGLYERSADVDLNDLLDTHAIYAPADEDSLIQHLVARDFKDKAKEAKWKAQQAGSKAASLAKSKTVNAAAISKGMVTHPKETTKFLKEPKGGRFPID